MSATRPGGAVVRTTWPGGATAVMPLPFSLSPLRIVSGGLLTVLSLHLNVVSVDGLFSALNSHLYISDAFSSLPATLVWPSFSLVAVAAVSWIYHLTRRGLALRPPPASCSWLAHSASGNLVWLICFITMPSVTVATPSPLALKQALSLAVETPFDLSWFFDSYALLLVCVITVWLASLWLWRAYSCGATTVLGDIACTLFLLSSAPLAYSGVICITVMAFMSACVAIIAVVTMQAIIRHAAPAIASLVRRRCLVPVLRTTAQPASGSACITRHFALVATAGRTLQPPSFFPPQLVPPAPSLLACRRAPPLASLVTHHDGLALHLSTRSDTGYKGVSVKVKYVLPTRERTYGRGTVRLRPHSLSLSHLPRDHTSVRSTRPHSRTPQFG